MSHTACLKDVLDLPIGNFVKIRIADLNDKTIYEDYFVNGQVCKTFLKYQEIEVVHIGVQNRGLSIRLNMYDKCGKEGVTA